MKNVLVINNPNAGRKKAAKYKKLVIQFLLRKNCSFKTIEISKLTSTDFEEFDTVFAIGGDGTVNKVIPYIVNTDKVLGIIPCGTANLLAAKLNIPTNPKKALEIINHSVIKNVDVLKVQDKYSVLRLGLGYDSDIICKTPQSLKNKFGYFAYFLAGILFALRLKQKSYTIFFNNKKLSILATCIIVANAGNMYRNLVSISNNCNLKDGKFEVFILKVKNPITFFIEFLGIIFNYKNSNSKAMYFQTNELLIKNEFSTGHIDGEKQKFKDDIKINIVPKSVKVFGN